jgi:hypothetical protein
MDLSHKEKEALNLSVEFDLRHVQLLKWPEDRSVIAQLDLIGLQCWYAGQDPRHMIYLAQNKEFRRFWNQYYMWPLRIKRFMFKIKHVLGF